MEESVQLCSLEISFEHLQWEEYPCCGVEECATDEHSCSTSPYRGMKFEGYVSEEGRLSCVPLAANNTKITLSHTFAL
jgi:hypothetical protein